jgi:DNA-binding protein H-NS
MAKTYADLQREIEALRREAEQARAEEVAGVVARIRQAIEVYGITAADLGFTSRGASVTRGPVPAGDKSAKFRDASGNTWGGRGPRPRWLRDALAAGKSLEEFAI